MAEQLASEAADRLLIDQLRVAVEAFEMKPGRDLFIRAGKAADNLVAATIGRRRITAEFAEHGPSLLDRFSEWAQLVPTAWHEGAHAVVGWALGRVPTRATIVPETIGGVVQLGSVTGVSLPVAFGGDDPERAARESAMVAFAGEIAEGPFMSSTCPGARARKWFAKSGFERATGWGTDRHRYTSLGWQCADEAYDVERALERWRVATVTVLGQRAVEVERVAIALLVRRELDEVALAELLGPAPGGERC